MRQIIACVSLAGLSVPALAATQDNNVEWNGISHLAQIDRLPLVPMDGESFTIRFQSFRGDLTSARVRVDDGSVSYGQASVVASRGPYDIWEATVPSTAASALSYVIEVSDGSDTDYLGVFGMSDELPGNAYEIDYDTLDHAPVGATPVQGGTVFKVWSPSRDRAWVRGQFNNWSTSDELTKVGEHFVGFSAGAQPGQMYKFYFANANGSNGVWNSDARGRRLNPTDNYNTFIVDPNTYQWEVEHFEPAPLEDMVIYQLHVGSFAGLNDPAGPTSNPSGYRDVADRADHLSDLGVNAVLFNPFMEFPGDFSGGYNPVTQYAPEWRYGTPDDLKYMIDELHKRGIAVLLDIVWNHFSFSDNFMWNYDGTQLYFDSQAVDTPWGAQADFGREGVRSYYLDSVITWLDEYKLDGFRMDATSFMDIQDGGWSLMQAMNDLIDNRYVDKVAIAEQLPDNDFITRPTSIGGAGFDSQYFDIFTDDLRDEIFNAAFRSVNIPRLAGITNGAGQFLSNTRVTNYFELHDEAWTLSGGQRAVKTIDTTFPHNDEFARSRTTLAQAFTMLTPGVPAFLMGTEWLESNGFEQERLDWSKKTTNDGTVRLYQDLVRLRAGNTAIRSNSPHLVYHQNDALDIMAWQRLNFDGLVYVMAANFSNTDRGIYRVGVPFEGRWEQVFNTQDAQYDGHGFGNDSSIFTDPIARDGFDQSVEINIPRNGLVVLQLNGPRDCPADVNQDGAVNGLDFGAWLNAFNAQDPSADQNGDGSVNGLDFGAWLANFNAGCD